MHLVAIDASLKNSAVVFGSPCSREFETFCESVEPGADSVLDRMARFQVAAGNIGAKAKPSEDKPRPAIVLIEGYSLGHAAARQRGLWEFGTLLRCEMVRRFENVLEIPPTVIKKFATGRGNAGKTEVVAALTKRYGVEYRTDDEYDAFALWRLGLHILGRAEVELPKANTAAVLTATEILERDCPQVRACVEPCNQAT